MWLYGIALANFTSIEEYQLLSCDFYIVRAGFSWIFCNLNMHFVLTWCYFAIQQAFITRSFHSWDLIFQFARHLCFSYFPSVHFVYINCLSWTSSKRRWAILRVILCFSDEWLEMLNDLAEQDVQGPYAKWWGEHDRWSHLGNPSCKFLSL